MFQRSGFYFIRTWYMASNFTDHVSWTSKTLTERIPRMAPRGQHEGCGASHGGQAPLGTLRAHGRIEEV